MGHKRTEIRQKIFDVLDGNTSAANVYINRETPQWQPDLPCIIIYSGQEQADPRNINARQYIRTWEVKLDVKVEANDSVDEDLDTISQEIEQLLIDNYSLSGLVLDIIYKSCDPQLDASGEKIIGTNTMNYEVKYIQ